MANSGVSEEVLVLFHAAKLGRTDIVQHAVSTFKSHNNNTPQDIAEFLSTPRTEDGATALHVASANGHADVVRALLNSGADPSKIPDGGDFAGKRAYEVAKGGAIQAFHVYFFEQIAMGHADIMKRLIQGGLDVELKDDSKTNDSTLHWACSFGNIEVTKVLVGLGANVNVLNKDTQTPLHYAAKSGSMELVKYLMNNGADTSILDSQNHTAYDLIPKKNVELIELYKSLDTKHSYVISEGAVDPNLTSSKSSPTIVTQSSSIDIDNSLEKINYNHLANPSPRASDDKRHINKYIDEDSHVTDCPSITTLEQFPIWPSPQYQQLYSNLSHFELSNDNLVIISVESNDIDMFPLLSWSGLMDTLHDLGLQTQVTRFNTSAAISLCIDTNLCPGRHHYELHINGYQDISDKGRISIAASDITGLLYGIRTLIQIIHLRDYFMAKQGDSINNYQNGIFLPSLTVIDWPDVHNRGVMWSYRNGVQSSSNDTKHLIKLFSELRLNQIYLNIENVYEIDNSSVNNSLNASKICALDEVCKRYCIDLIPTITISKHSDRINIDILRNFTSPTIMIIFNLEIDHSENSDIIKNNISVLKDVCSQIFYDVHFAGFKSVFLSCNGTFKSLISPTNIANQLGFRVLDISLETLLLHPSLALPILHTHQLSSAVLNRVKRFKSIGRSLCVIPTMNEADFMYPLLLLKHISFLYGGACWNAAKYEIYFNQDNSNTKDLRQFVKFFLFNQYSSGDPTKNQLQGTVLDLLVGQLNFNSTVDPSQLRYADSTLWTNLSISLHPANWIFCVSKSDTTEMLKCLRKVLSSAGWKFSGGYYMNDSTAKSPSSNNSSVSYFTNKDTKPVKQRNQEIEELMSIIYLFSVWCRTIVLSFTALEKNSSAKIAEIATSHLTLGNLLGSMAPGTASDIANAFLEAITHCHKAVWRNRFENIHLISPQVDTLRNDFDGSNIAFEKYILNILLQRFLNVRQPEIPALSVYRAMCSHLPTYSESLLVKIFEESQAEVGSNWWSWTSS